MTESNKLRFGSDYNYNYEKPPEENWKEMRKYYLKKKGLDIGDFPEITDEKMAEYAKLLEGIK